MKQKRGISALLLLFVLWLGAPRVSAQNPSPMTTASLPGQWRYEGTCTDGQKKMDKLCSICDNALKESGFPAGETIFQFAEDGSFTLRGGEKETGGEWELENDALTLRFRGAFHFTFPGTIHKEGEEGFTLLFPYSKYEGFLQRIQSVIGKADTFLTIVALQTTVSDSDKVLVGFRLSRLK